MVKNLNDKVILGLSFIHLLYPFTTEEDGITTIPFGQPVKFNFLNKIEQNTFNLLKENSISESICLMKNKRQQLNFLNEEIKFKRLEQQLTCKILQQLNYHMLRISMKETSLLNLDYTNELKNHGIL